MTNTPGNGLNTRLLWWIMGVLLTAFAGSSVAILRNEDGHSKLQESNAACVRVSDNHEQRLRWLEEQVAESQKTIMDNQARILQALEAMEKKL